MVKKKSKPSKKPKVVIRSTEDLILLHKYSCDTARSLMVGKNADYADSADPFWNLHDGGAYGILIRLGDKYKRLLNFERRLLKDPKRARFQVADEKIVDTAFDLINYTNLYLGYKHRRK